jgi:hypothetical protein
MPTAINEDTGEIFTLDQSGKWQPAKRAKNDQTGEEFYLDGTEWKTAPLSKKDVTVGRAGAAADAVTLGLGDEFLSGVGAFFDTAVSKQGQAWMLPDAGDTFSRSYDRRLKDLRGIQSRYAAYDPVENLAINVAAGIPTAIATGGGALTSVKTLAPKLGAVGQAAGVGALYGGAVGLGEGEGGVGNRLASGAVGAGIGALTGAAIEGVAVPAVSRLVEAVRGRPQLFDPQTLTLTVEGQRVAQRAGLDPAEANAALQQEFSKLARNALDPADAARVAEANTLPVKVPMTRGQATLDPAQQMFESQAAEGMFTPQISSTMRQFRDEQASALLGNVQGIQRTIGGNTVSETGQGVQAARDALISQNQALRARTNQLYDSARKTAGNAFVLGNNVADGLAGIRQTLDGDGLTARVAPRVHGLIDDVAQDLLATTQQVGKNPKIDVGNVFGIRQQLAALSRSTDAVEATAAGNAKRQIDAFLNNAIDEDLIAGDPAVVELWRRAIASRRELAEKFPKNSLAEKLVRRAADGSDELALDSNAAMNLIFNSKGTGWASRSGIVKGLMQVRNRLENNPEAWNSLREEAFMRIARDAQSKDARGITEFSGQKFQTAWENFLKNSPEVARIMFTKDELSLINQFSRVAKRVTTTVPGGRAPSGTPLGIASIMKNLWRSTFLGPKMAAFLDGVPILKGAQNLANEVRVTAAIKGGIPTGAPTPQRLPLPPEATALGTATASQQFNQ